MKPRAICPAPDCGKVLVVGGAGKPWPNHRRPTGGNCWLVRNGPGQPPVRARDLVHPCKRCRALPVRSPDWSAMNGDATEWRPESPRPLKARGYCASHLRDVERTEKESRSVSWRKHRRGLDEDDQAELLAEQDGACACGVVHATAKTAMHVDHDHEREGLCVAAGRHPAGKSCHRCARGLAGNQCNRIVLGRYTAAQLRSLADYLERPTAQRLGWWNDDIEEMQNGAAAER